jgi:hypothetical protein
MADRRLPRYMLRGLRGSIDWADDFFGRVTLPTGQAFQAAPVVVLATIHAPIHHFRDRDLVTDRTAEARQGMVLAAITEASFLGAALILGHGAAFSTLSASP